MLYDLENPLMLDNQRSEDVIKYREQEKEFANKVKQVCEDFQDTVMKCTGTTTQKAAIYSDALMSYASPQTGEAVNIYRAVSEENVSQLLELEGNFNTKYYDLLSNRYKSNTILEYARLYLDGTMQMWIDAKDSIKVW